MQQSKDFLSSDTMKILINLQGDMRELTVKQENIKEDLNELKKLRIADSEKTNQMDGKISDLCIDVNNIKLELSNSKQKKKESRSNLLQWIGSLTAIATLVAYLTYEVGLHKISPYQTISKDIKTMSK